MTQQTHKHKGIQREQGIHKPQVPRLLPLKQAGEWLGLTLWAMRERVWSGDIPFIKFPGGRKIFIDTRDLEAFIQRNKVTYD